jgi:hypothetical protein
MSFVKNIDIFYGTPDFVIYSGQDFGLLLPWTFEASAGHIILFFVPEALRAELRSGNAEVRAFFWLYLPRICADLGLTSPELPHTEAAVCLGILDARFFVSKLAQPISFLFHSISHSPRSVLLASFGSVSPLLQTNCSDSSSPVSVQAGGFAAPRLPQGRGRILNPMVCRV